jgi:hypothetical protein
MHRNHSPKKSCVCVCVCVCVCQAVTMLHVLQHIIFIGAVTWWFFITNVINYFRHHFNLRILWWFNKVSGVAIMIFVFVSTVIVLFNGSPVI